MGMDIREALLKAQLVTEEAYKKTKEQEKTRNGQQIGRLKGKISQGSLMNLEEATKVSEFKVISKRLLIEFPCKETAVEIAKLAHNISHLAGGKKLIWLILNLRNNIENIKDEFKGQVIKRALRSSCPTVEIPADWKK